MIHTDRLEYFNREENDRQFGQSLITISLINVCSSAFFLQCAHLRCSFGSRRTKEKAKQKPGEKAEMEQGPVFPRCSWLLHPPEDLSKHFQDKEIVCLGAQIANPRV